MAIEIPYVEDLPALAADAYALADRLCGACRNFHALWPYRRITRQFHEADTDQLAAEAALAELIAAGHRRVMIAGAADSGVVASVARAARGKDVSILVVDLCDTPLELCRRFAAHWRLPLETARADLLEIDLTALFDIVYANSILQFFSREQQRALMRRIARSLQPGGMFVQTFNVGRGVGRESLPGYREEYCRWVLDELARRGIALPEESEAFAARVAAYSSERAAREGAFDDAEDVATLLAETGFAVMRMAALDVPVEAPYRGFVAKLTKQRYLALARRLPA